MKVLTIFMRRSSILFLFSLFFACSRPTGKVNSETSNDIVSGVEASPESTIFNFLKWYDVHRYNLLDDLVLYNSSETRDTSKFYAVNFTATEKYLATLTETKMVSTKYADKWREYFKKCEQHFKEHPSNEGPPEGFDYDFILFSQEDPGLKELNKTKMELVKKEGNSVQLLIHFPSNYHYKYQLSLDGKHWIIDDIEPVYK
jgi:hypothetical protein